MAKKYYWLKLKEDFFRQKEIRKLRKIAGGDVYTIIYLKMQLLSLKNNGVIEFEGTEKNLAEQLSYQIDEDEDNIGITLKFLESNKLLESINDNEYLLTKASECIGKEGESAERMRKLREKKKKQQIPEKTTPSLCDNSVTKSDTEKEKEKEKELDIELDKDNNKEINLLSLFESLGFGTLSSFYAEQISDMENTFSTMWVKEAMEEAAKQGVRNIKYVEGILKNWKTKGFKADKPKKTGYVSKEKKNSFNNFTPRDYGDRYDKLLENVLSHQATEEERKELNRLRMERGESPL